MSETDLFPGARRAEQYDEEPAGEPPAPAMTPPPAAAPPVPPQPIDEVPQPDGQREAGFVAAPRSALASPEQAAGVYATWGKRGLVNHFGFRLRPTEAELAHLDEIRVIRQATWTRPVRVLVANPKSSAKTPTSLILGGTFAAIRGGNVVTWEVAEAKGTLRYRAEGEPSRGLYELVESANQVTTSGVLGGFTQPQTSHLDVIGSIKDRPVLRARDIQTVATILDREYRICVMDPGNNLHSEAFNAAVNLADVIVVPVLWSSIDTTHGALDLLEALEASPALVYQALARRAIIVTSHDGRPENPDVVARIHAALEAAPHRARFDVPFDPHIAVGEKITLSALSDASTRAWTTCAAEVIRTLQEAVD